MATKAAYKRVRQAPCDRAGRRPQWEKVAGRKQKQPWFIRRRDGEPSRSPACGRSGTTRTSATTRIGRSRSSRRTPTSWCSRCTIACRSCSPNEWDRWLDPTYQDVGALQELLVPAPDDDFEAWPVGTLVNKADNDGPELLDPSSSRPHDAARRARRGDPEKRAAVTAAAPFGRHRCRGRVMSRLDDRRSARARRPHPPLGDGVGRDPSKPPDGDWRGLEEPPVDVAHRVVRRRLPTVRRRARRPAAGAEVWTWTADHTAAFWSRRQAHGLAIHRWGAQRAR